MCERRRAMSFIQQPVNAAAGPSLRHGRRAFRSWELHPAPQAPDGPGRQAGLPQVALPAAGGSDGRRRRSGMSVLCVVTRTL